MKLKKFIATLLSVVMISTLLAGCSGKTDTTEKTDTGNETKTETSNEPTKADSTTDSNAEDAEKNYDETLTIDIYDAAANYQGLQSGWFQKVVKDRFNMELNIIAPQVAGDAIYQTRASTGNLGDIVILDATDFMDCVQNGLIKDITADFDKYPNLMDYKEQVDVYNKGLPGNDAGNIYGIPCQMTNTSPTSYSQDVIYSSPLLRWDLYKEIGSPDIQDLDGLLDALEAMMKAHPTNEEGDPAYPFSLWPDWDGGDGMMGIANVVQLTTWYGEKIKGSVILKPDGTFTPLTDKNATYYKMLQFLNKAYQRGLVDPDSGTQDWNAACAKMSAGQVYLMWYSWQVGFWNSQERLKNGNAFIFIPVKDQLYYADSDTYYGSGRVFGVGSQVDDAKYSRIMDFLDWYASPEGLTFQHNGIEGFNYTIGEDGRYTVMNDNALMDNLPVPEEWGGGGYQDGNNAINQWIVDAISTNPNTGEPYSTQYWSTYKEATMTQMKEEWQEKFGAAEPAEYMKNNNVLLVSPNVSVSLPSDTNDIAVIRSQCSDTLNDYSWRMIFAKDQAEFDAMWDDMAKQMDGFGFQDIVAFDKEKYQIELDAKNAAK
ncbi:sugar ABC transporter substrate-binding protein [Lachnospiraceae bacterium MD1]|uniref:Sugar ABC transporter substrate-binding protein n=1 Tax=Variimorphobacter saccharofermentans TaxID=2755051 RepID=A0A839K2L4_9FIRM|nr:sugar ABC transporter substrate-binding protein [Variimorphobacter saccharofermentans]MBB2183860.1 sugar ABC transporter substrate-binding protein [Variimorphobacter saccharofermentans]